MSRILRLIARIIGLLLVVLVAYVAGRLLLVEPRTDRNWRPEHTVTADIRFDGDLVHVNNVRNATYRSGGEVVPGYYDRTFDLDKLDSVWFVVSPFGSDWRGPAHSLLSFGFADSQFVGISVEARKEVGESYSIWKGLVNTYELLYVVGDERDLIGVRAVHWNDDVYVFPLKTTRARIRTLFVAMLERATKLQTEPEFYNTAVKNCTTSLYDHAKSLHPEEWSYSWKLQLPGYADEILFDKGMIDTDLSLEEAREQFNVRERAARSLDDPDFSVLIRR